MIPSPQLRDTFVVDALAPPLIAERRPSVGRTRPLLRWILLAGGVTALAVLAVVLIDPGVLTPYNPLKIDLAARFQGFSRSHPFGTDEFGRDLLSRLLYGARMTLGGAALLLAAGVVISAIAALLATFGPRPVRVVVLRVIDLFLALPQLVVAFAVVGLLGPSFANTLIALAVTGWAAEARVFRGLLAAPVNAPYVEAAFAAGGTRRRIVWHHVLPAVTGRAAVVVSLRLGGTILALSALSFLGLGAQPPAPEWGAMLSEAKTFLYTDPALMIVPGVAVALTVAASNLLADAFSARADLYGAPRRHRRTMRTERDTRG